MGENIGVYSFWRRKPEANKPHRRSTHRWEDNIKMDLLEVGYGGLDWIDLAQDRGRRRAVVNEVMNIWVT
jgi:hypothetical protein